MQFAMAGARRSRPPATRLGGVPMPLCLAANSVAAFDDAMLLATVLVLPGRNTGEVLLSTPRRRW